MNAENKLFRREQLIDEMIAYIKEKDPDFNIQDKPSFQVYLDEDVSQRSKGKLVEPFYLSETHVASIQDSCVDDYVDINIRALPIYIARMSVCG